mmetsp:Transcript_6680/g.12225  ORF Transcript_6680/g.12225 Transcript_6680/m.12225 type:complete len:277 (+) Transcript_6680:156-986(+)
MSILLLPSNITFLVLHGFDNGSQGLHFLHLLFKVGRFISHDGFHEFVFHVEQHFEILTTRLRRFHELGILVIDRLHNDILTFHHAFESDTHALKTFVIIVTTLGEFDIILFECVNVLFQVGILLFHLLQTFERSGELRLGIHNDLILVTCLLFQDTHLGIGLVESQLEFVDLMHQLTALFIQLLNTRLEFFFPRRFQSLFFQFELRHLSLKTRHGTGRRRKSVGLHFLLGKRSLFFIFNGGHDFHFKVIILIIFHGGRYRQGSARRGRWRLDIAGS